MYKKPLIWVALSIILILPLANQADATSWYNSSWLKARKITVDDADITADLTNYPLYVNFTSAGIGSIIQADCDDIVFTDYYNTTKLSHEIEHCNATDDHVEAWIKIPAVFNANATVIYMYYDNAAATDQQDQYNTWRTEFKSVYHLNGTFANSANANNGLTNSGASAKSEQYIGDSNSFDGINDYLESGAFTTLSSDKAFMSGWVQKLDSNAPAWATIAKNWGNSVQGQYHFGLENTGEAVSIYIVQSGGTAKGPVTDPTSLSAGVWTFMAWEANGTYVNLYRNGVKVGTPVSYDGTLKTSFCSGEMWIGLKSADDCTAISVGAPGPWEGALDEIRYYNTNAPSGWIKADYECQRGNGNSCITIGAEGTEPSTGSSQTYVDTLALSDTLVFTGTGQQSYSDTLAITDALTFSGTGTQVYTDTLALSDNLVFLFNDLHPKYNDTLQFTDGYVQSCTGSCGIVANPNAIVLSVNKSPFTFKTYSDATRPACVSSIVGGVIWNTNDSNLNICTGTNWILPNGTAT